MRRSTAASSLDSGIRDRAERLAALGFFLVPVSALAAFIAARVVAHPDAAQLAASGIAVVGFVLGLTGLRHRATGKAFPVRLVVATGAASLAIMIGTIVDVSGVLLGVPIAALAALVIWRGSWRLGDTVIFLLLIGVAAAGA